MATSHLIHDEASAVLYGRNRFRWSIYGDTHQTIFQESNRDDLHLPANYIRHITRIHIVVKFMGDAYVSGPEGNCRVIALTSGLLRRCCVALVSNRLREAKVTYIDFSATAFPIAMFRNNLFGTSSLSSNVAITHELRMGQTILEPLKLLKGVEKVKFVAKGLFR